MNNVFIVAEIGCNHNGDKKLAKKLVEEAKKCGVENTINPKLSAYFFNSIKSL